MEEVKIKKKRNSNVGPKTIEEARKMARIRASDAAPLWGMDRGMLQRRCIRGEISDAVQPGKGQEWYVTPAGMDDYFDKPKKKR